MIPTAGLSIASPPLETPATRACLDAARHLLSSTDGGTTPTDCGSHAAQIPELEAVVATPSASA